MSFTLTAGAVGRLLEGGAVDSPILQILGFKKIAGQGGADRYRLNVSDGVVSHTYAMLATQLNHMIPSGKLDSNCIIRVDKVISNSIGERRVLIILELTVLANGTDVANKIGNPVQWTEPTGGMSNGAGAAAPSRPNATNGNATGYGKPAATGTSNPGTAFPGKKTESSYASKSTAPNVGGGEFHTGPVVPIRDLNPYNGRCAIRARVTSKSDVRTWSNTKGDGKLFNIELLDDTGEIRMTGFNNSVDQFYDSLDVGSVYILKNFQVKTSNRAFNSLPHDYELSMGNETQIIPYTDDTSRIPTATYNFAEIAKVEELEKDTIVDVIGICKMRGELNTFTSRAGKEMTKRDIILVDKSNREVSLTLWGKQAEEFSDDSQPVVAIKGAKVGDYNGKNLSCLNSSSFMVNPDIPEAHSLRGWFDNEGKSAESRSLSGIKGPGAATPWKVLRESVISDQADSEKGDFFMSKVTVMSVKRDNPAYQACPAPNCQKKVVDMGSGSYRCEKCCREYPDFKWRMMLQVNFADFSGNVWGTCFQDTAETLLGQSADVLGPMHKENPDAFDAVIKTALFQSYIVKFKSKVETFNNETRRKATVLELHPLNFSEYIRKLTAEIKESAF